MEREKKLRRWGDLSVTTSSKTPSILVTQLGPLVSKALNATQIYAQKCTTKPFALKPAIEFSSPNTADEEAVCHSRCFTTKKKSWGRILDKILFSSIIHLALFYLRTGVCYIWSYPKSHSTTCGATLIMFLVHTGPFLLSGFPSHLG